jgi:hypothetical protein
MKWEKKNAKAKRKQQKRSKERKKATATATPLPVTADQKPEFNKNGLERKTGSERHNQVRRAKERRALSKQIGSTSPVPCLLPSPSDEDFFSDLGPLSAQ